MRDRTIKGKRSNVCRVILSYSTWLQDLAVTWDEISNSLRSRWTDGRNCQRGSVADDETRLFIQEHRFQMALKTGKLTISKTDETQTM